MATQAQCKRDIQAARDSKVYAQALYNRTPTRDDRRFACRDFCRQLGMPGAEKAGDLLEHLQWMIRSTTSDFGAYDTAEVISAHLGWSSRDMVKRELDKLRKYGAIETGLGIPKGRVGPTNHYRITHKLGQMILALVARVKRTAQTMRAKAPKLSIPVLSTKTRQRPKPFKSQATRNPAPVPAAHRAFKPNPPRNPAQPAKVAAILGGLKSLLRGGATQ